MSVFVELELFVILRNCSGLCLDLFQAECTFICTASVIWYVSVPLRTSSIALLVFGLPAFRPVSKLPRATAPPVDWQTRACVSAE